MSDKLIPDNFTNIVSLSGKFSFNYSKQTLPISNIITNTEYNIHNIPYDKRNTVRGNISYWI